MIFKNKNENIYKKVMIQWYWGHTVESSGCSAQPFIKKNQNISKITTFWLPRRNKREHTSYGGVEDEVMRRGIEGEGLAVIH